MVSEFHLFTRVTVAKAKSVVANPDEPATPFGVGGFADWAMLTLHALRIELGKSYRVTVDLLSEMPGILDEIGHTRLPHYTTVYRVRSPIHFSIIVVPSTTFPVRPARSCVASYTSSPSL